MVRNGICTRSDLFIMIEGIAEGSGEMPGVWKVLSKEETRLWRKDHL